MRRISSAFTCFIALSFSSAQATTWMDRTDQPDPVLDGATCEVSDVASHGSYIYHWPSKYDQVFWPLTDPKGIWFCPHSGFTALIDDFEISPAEKAALAAHLGASYKPSDPRPDLRQKLMLLEQSYSLRETSGEFKIRLLRVLAYLYEAELRDYAAATKYRKEALQMMEEALLAGSRQGPKLEYLFVSAAYYREFGDVVRSDIKLGQLEGALRVTRSKEFKGFVEYLRELKEDLMDIEPGGRLAPASRDRKR